MPSGFYKFTVSNVQQLEVLLMQVAGAGLSAARGASPPRGVLAARAHGGCPLPAPSS